jgi:hypothetical protein
MDFSAMGSADLSHMATAVAAHTVSADHPGIASRLKVATAPVASHVSPVGIIPAVSASHVSPVGIVPAVGASHVSVVGAGIVPAVDASIIPAVSASHVSVVGAGCIASARSSGRVSIAGTGCISGMRCAGGSTMTRGWCARMRGSACMRRRFGRCTLFIVGEHQYWHQHEGQKYRPFR